MIWEVAKRPPPFPCQSGQKPLRKVGVGDKGLPRPKRHPVRPDGPPKARGAGAELAGWALFIKKRDAVPGKPADQPVYNPLRN